LRAAHRSAVSASPDGAWCAVHFQQQHGACCSRQRGLRHFADESYRASVHEFEYPRRAGLGHYGGDSGGSTDHVPVNDSRGDDTCRKRSQQQGSLADDGKSAFRTDQQTGEVISDHPFCRVAARSDRTAIARDGTEPQGVVPWRAVFQRPWSRRVAAQVPADGAVIRRSGIRRPEKTIFRRCPLQATVGHPRLDDRHSIRGIDVHNPVHPFGGKDETAGRGYCGAGGACAATPDGER
jgi:hypothetical protein